MEKTSYSIRTLKLNFYGGTESIHSRISEFFDLLYHTETEATANEINYKMNIVKEPSSIPDGSRRAMGGPVINYLTHGKNIYFISKGGSLICLDRIDSSGQCFFTEAIIRDRNELFPLLAAPIIELMGCQGLHFLHASALYRNELGFLFSGEGGSGKTTIAIGLIREGFSYISDDSLYLCENGGRISVSPMYTEFHVIQDPDLSSRFPDVFPNENSDIPKQVKISVNMSELFPGSFVESFSPHVIIFPQITKEEDSTLLPIGKTEMLKRLLRQTIFTVDRDRTRHQLKVLEKLVKQTRGYQLLSGRDVYENPKKLVEILGRANHLYENAKKI